LNLFDKENEFRKFLFRFVSSEKFEQYMLIFILLSAVVLAFNNPFNDPNGSLSRSIYWIDFATTIIFLFEFLAKTIAYGFIFNGPPSYLKNPWNLMDFIIVILSLASISPLVNKL
jgi:hypothetical protein